MLSLAHCRVTSWKFRRLEDRKCGNQTATESGLLISVSWPTSQAMQLTEEAIKLIGGKNFGYLATVMKDGSPQVTPVWVDLEGKDYILVNTALGRIKQKNTKRKPKVAIAIADESNQYERVTVRGVVIEQTTKGADEHIDRLAKKYLGRETYPYRSPKEKRVILKIRPEHISK